MASIVKIKRSSVQGKAPTISAIQSGELALNTRDGKLFSSDGSSVFEVGANLSSLSTSSITVSDSSRTDLRVTVTNTNGSANNTALSLVNDQSQSLEVGVTGSGYIPTDDGILGYIYPSNTVGSFIIGNQANTFIFGGNAFGGQDGNAAISITSSNTGSPTINFLGQFNFPTTIGTYGQVLTVSNTANRQLGWGAPTLQTVTESGNTTTREITVGRLTSAGQTLPASDGTSGQVLKTDGNGNLFWEAAGTGAGTFQFYKNVGTADLEADGITVTGGEFPFYQQDGTYDPVPVS
jgi:hypothetical protein